MISNTQNYINALEAPDNYFKKLRSNNHNNLIYVEDLYDAYVFICQTKGINYLSYMEIKNLLNSITYKDHTNIKKKLINIGYKNTNLSNEQIEVITREKFERFKFIAQTYDYYKRYNKLNTNQIIINLPLQVSPIISFIRAPKTISNISIIISLILFVQILLIIWIIISKYNSYSIYLLSARIGAIIILYNLGLLLIHISNILDYIDHRLIHKLSSNNSNLLHILFGYNIIIGTIIHIIGHLLHINYSLIICKEGCTYDDIHIVAQDNSIKEYPIHISWKYFMNHPSYYSGIIITIILLLIGLQIILKKYNLIRSAIFYNYHRLLAIIISLGIIIHGLERLLGFNLSYIFVLPPLLIYLLSRYMEICCYLIPNTFTKKVEIIGYHATSSMIRLCFLNTPYMAKKLEYGIAVSAYINHPSTAKYEWHPFTISSSIDSKSLREVLSITNNKIPSMSYITIKNSGVWTSKFIENIINNGHHPQSINIGHIIPSCFRFHKFYKYKLFFCSGVGITPFLTIIYKSDKLDKKNLLVWSISSIDLLKEFGDILIRIKKTIPSLEIVIFYSNSADQINQSISDNQWLKFNFLQTIIHKSTQIDIIHGSKIPVISILNRANPEFIISHMINDMSYNNKLVGIFICGGANYTQSVVQCTKQFEYNIKKITLDIWVENL